MKLKYCLLFLHSMFVYFLHAQHKHYNTQTAKERLQGTWVIVEERSLFKRLPPEYTEFRMTFSDDSVFMIFPLYGDTLKGIFRAWTEIGYQTSSIAKSYDHNDQEDGDPNEAEYTYVNDIVQYNCLAARLARKDGLTEELSWFGFELTHRSLAMYHTHKNGQRYRLELVRWE